MNSADIDGPGDRVPVMELQGALADRDAWSSTGWCRLERALDVIGTRSAMLLLRESFYGSTRFEDLVRGSELSEAVVAGRLKELTRQGLLARSPYREPGARTRFEYLLTPLGSRLFPMVVALVQWGDLLDDDASVGVEFVHRTCGEPIHVAVTCADGHDVGLSDAAARFKNESLVLRSRRRGRKDGP